MGGFGAPELLIIFVVVLLVFGPRKIPEVARALGRLGVEFRKLSIEFQRELNLAHLLEETKSGRSPRDRAAASAPPSVASAGSLDVEIDPNSPHARAAAATRAKLDAQAAEASPAASGPPPADEPSSAIDPPSASDPPPASEPPSISS